MKIEKTTGTHCETIEFTPELARAWLPAPFQRGVTVNQNVRDLVETLKEDGGVLPGVIHFGVLDRKTYLLDGQQRREAFLLSECPLGYADARYVKCENMAQMAQEFVNLNGHLVGTKPDDILRSLEHCHAPLHKLRQACDFIGYDSVRRGPGRPLLSMSVVLRCWAAAQREIPSSVSVSSKNLAGLLTEEEANRLARFLGTCYGAWGRDPEYSRLWCALNLTLCGWLWRRTVLAAYSARSERLTDTEFDGCLLSLSASGAYMEYLVGRRLTEVDRGPAYHRIKDLFVKRLTSHKGKKIALPSPAWSPARGRQKQYGAGR